jgi:hypothetical protein
VAVEPARGDFKEPRHTNARTGIVPRGICGGGASQG